MLLKVNGINSAIRGSPMSHKLTLSTIVLLIGFLGAKPALALPCDELGSIWEGCEYGSSCEWKFNLKRRSCNSNVWNGTWYHPRYPSFSTTITISIIGDNVTMSRSAVGGVSCTYSGKYRRRDTTNASPYRVSGRYSCSNCYSGPWRANIR